MIQEIEPKVFHNEYHNYRIDEGDRILCYSKNEIMLKLEDGYIELPIYKKEYGNPDKYVYAFSMDKVRYYVLLDNSVVMNGYNYEDVRIARTAKPEADAYAVICGKHLHTWYMSNRFCGACGSLMESDDKERMLKCPKCNHIVYPRIDPVAIVALHSGDKLLMTKYANRDYKKYALVAGFNEFGEGIEDTVRREVMEEVGLKVKNIKFYKSQPW